MKNFRRFGLFIFMLVLAVSFNIKVNAATYTTDDGSYNYTTNVVETKTLGKETTYIHDSGYTTRTGTKIEQDVFMLSQKTDKNQGTKVVTWAVSSGTGADSTNAYTRTTLAKIAADYEKNHPGWKVLGGINADQYYQYFGTKLTEDGSDLFLNQPYYPMMSDNENWFTIDPLGRTVNIVGFKNDGSTKPLVYDKFGVTGLQINIYNENNEFVGKFKADALNPTTFTSGTAVYCAYNTDQSGLRANAVNTMNVSSTNGLYIASKADKAYVSNSTTWSWYKTTHAKNAFFGKGEIDKIETSYQLATNQFAIETTNQSLKNALKVGCYVVAQYEFEDELQNCGEGIGYHTVQRRNNQDQAVANSYNTRGYPRSVFGCTSDGTMVLIATDGKTVPNYGMYAQEINALCKAYDITDAYQMDGGGSVTMVVRNEEGGFTTVTTPADGSDRSIFSGMFIVMRDIDVNVSAKEITESSIALDVNVIDVDGIEKVEECYVNLIGKNSSGKAYNETKKVVNKTVLFDNLLPNYEFSYKILYTTATMQSPAESFSNGKYSTLKRVPIISSAKINFIDGRLSISVQVIDKDVAISSNLGVSFDGGKTYERLQANHTIAISDFSGDPLADIIIRVYYDTNDGEGRRYVYISDMEINFTYAAFLESLSYNFDGISSDMFK